MIPARAFIRGRSAVLSNKSPSTGGLTLCLLLSKRPPLRIRKTLNREWSLARKLCTALEISFQMPNNLLERRSGLSSSGHRSIAGSTCWTTVQGSRRISSADWANRMYQHGANREIIWA